MGEGGWPWGAWVLTVTPSRKLQCCGRLPRLVWWGQIASMGLARQAFVIIWPWTIPCRNLVQSWSPQGHVRNCSVGGGLKPFKRVWVREELYKYYTYIYICVCVCLLSPCTCGGLRNRLDIFRLHPHKAKEKDFKTNKQTRSKTPWSKILFFHSLLVDLFSRMPGIP